MAIQNFSSSTEGKERPSISKSGFNSKKEAKNAGDLILSNLVNKQITITALKEDITFGELLDEWLENYGESNLKETTLQGYKKNVNHIIKKALGNIPLAEINAITIQKFVNEMFKNGYAYNRVSSCKGNINSALNYAVRMQRIPHNPALSVLMPNKRKLNEEKPECLPKERKVVEEHEWKAIINRYPEGDSAHFPLIAAYRLGNRLGETFGYVWDDIDWKRRTIWVHRQVNEKRKEDENGCRWYVSAPKYDSVREIELDDATYNLLLRMREKQEKHQEFYKDIGYDYFEYYIDETKTIRTLHHSEKVPLGWKRMDFINVRSDSSYINPGIMRNVSRVIHGKANGRGIDEKIGMALEYFCYHALRHTHGTMLATAGFDYKYITERMGHKDIQTTFNIYVHSSQSMRDKERKGLNKLYD